MQLPAWTWFYGLRPWEVERMPLAEIHQYQLWMEKNWPKGEK